LGTLDNQTFGGHTFLKNTPFRRKCLVSAFKKIPFNLLILMHIEIFQGMFVKWEKEFI
jgi:hypothetical protein